MKRVLAIFALSGLMAADNVQAEVSDEEFAALREQLAAVSARLDELAAENAELRKSQAQTTAAAPAPVAAAETWTDRVKLDGDFRYRFEDIDAEGSSTRQRSRVRARVNLKAQASDNVEIGVGLATGGSDPVSTNQTLGSGGSSKGVVLNLAYANWKINDQFNLIGGKFKNPLHRPAKNPMMWDGDWTPEGLAVTYKNGRYFANLIGTYLESDTRRDNSFAWGGQFGATGSVGDIKLKGGIGFYSMETRGNETSFGDTTDAGDFFGNSAIEAGGAACGTTPGADCFYLYDYKLTEVFGEASTRIGDWPATFFMNYVTNSDASSNDTAWTIGTQIGQTKNPGEMRFTYYYADKEADSMLGLLSDSDFGGGGTDSKGHFLQFNYGVNKSWTIGAQYFINESNVASGANSDYNRLMIDSAWKWK
ncbi:MAG: putative porin [Pseudomonadota bacterium]